MLFDLRGAGRRRTVKFVYLGLALVMFVGFVGFSIGSSGLGGGIIDAITQNQGSGGSGTGRFEDQVRRAQAQTRARPQDPAAWEQLALARVRLAGVGDNFDTGSNTYTSSGKQILQGASSAWDRYLALNPKHVDDSLARQMLSAFIALNKPAEAATAQEIVAEANPTSSNYANLAVYAYTAGQTRKGDLASQKAISLAPKSERKALKSQLDQAKAQAAGAASASPTPSG